MKDRRRASRESMAWTLAFGQPEDRAPTHWLRGDARGRDGGVRQKVAAGVSSKIGKFGFGGKPEEIGLIRCGPSDLADQIGSCEATAHMSYSVRRATFMS